MSHQLAINWSTDVHLPVVGRSLQARHAGSVGAQVASRTRGALVVAYLNLLAIGGARGFSDQEAADALGRRLSSICSTRNSLKDRIVASGSFETTPYKTKRARFTLAQFDNIGC